ncbi:hypothetical protein PU560_02125 [Georgenia sp. 10Sc9-8]|uniref:Ceramidase n=1 Tax=Georgenia halotolerans TaxID=3028317 RepID=A0ABT5TT80_9MICO|nr:hypothetical protein [Georgenia halotolerans]
MLSLPWLPTPAVESGPGCEVLQDGLLQEPIAAVTSLAFVVAAVVVLLLERGTGNRAGPSRRGSRGSLLIYVALVAGVGIGSLIQHGPDPVWSDPAHDVPLLATVAFVGADAAAALTGRRRAWWWWALPTVALMPLVVALPRPGDVAQVAVAVVAVVLTLARAWTFPAVRRRIGWAVALLAAGGVLGALSRADGPLCDPTSLWQGHAVWHILAAVALVVLAPVVTRR